MIFGSTLLEVAIGVIFVYLLLSLLCSAFSELIEAFLKYRARDLEKGISKLLDNPQLAQKFFAHPLIKPLGENPSYVPARTFSLALWNLATTKAGEAKNIAGGVTQDLNAIRGIISSLDDQQYKNIKTSLLTLIDEAGSDINKARTNIEDWYNDAMDRVSGWYKRRVHKILIVIGFIAAAILNVDTINIAKTLWYNDTLRASVTAAAENYVKVNPKPTPTPPATTPPVTTPPETTTPSTTTTTTAPQGETVTDADSQALVVREKINNIRSEIDNLGLPISWVLQPDKNDDKYKDKDGKFDKPQYDQDMLAYTVDPRRLPNDWRSGLLKLLGIFLTALAVSQGAPFWFDLLNKIIVIRSTIKPHEKSPDQPSKDSPAPDVTKKEPEKEDEEGANKG
ncbi:MAG: hypothetical protein QOJ02_2635 [Acidobacteriota bacterium]|jgi:hypothetical protein|nr:hypothetical protein [Acidobacteriota bacterium]